MYRLIHEDFELLFDEVSPSGVVAQKSSGLHPSLRFTVIRKHAYIRIYEDP